MLPIKVSPGICVLFLAGKADKDTHQTHKCMRKLLQITHFKKWLWKTCPVADVTKKKPNCNCFSFEFVKLRNSFGNIFFPAEKGCSKNQPSFVIQTYGQWQLFSCMWQPQMCCIRCCHQLWHDALEFNLSLCIPIVFDSFHDFVFILFFFVQMTNDNSSVKNHLCPAS